MMDMPAHKIIINNFLDWDKVKKRLDRYKLIADIFTYQELEKCSKKVSVLLPFLKLETWNMGK